jgi:hypothetical protein
MSKCGSWTLLEEEEEEEVNLSARSRSYIKVKTIILHRKNRLILFS